MTSEAQPHRGVTAVASRFNGWERGGKGKACRRYATFHVLLSRTYGTLVSATDIPAIEMAGYHCRMPLASAVPELSEV